MTKKAVSWSVLPVLFGFFVMGFCDVVGIATSYVKEDFHLTETVAGFLPSMVFLWFLLLSVPTAILMNKIGRKQTVMLSMLVTIIGMFVPFISYSIVTCMAGFALLGIGNTILQVSLNPLLTNVVKGDALTSSLTAGQVVKAVSSFAGPVIASFALNSLGNWHFLFPVFAGITVLSGLWLILTSVPKEEESITSSSLVTTFSLLKDKTIFILFLGIVFVVGTDVGMNTVAPKLLIERLNMPVADAGFGSSLYFAFRTFGALLGAVLLARMNEIKYFRINMIIAIAAILALFFLKEQNAMLVLIGVVGFTCSSIFAVIYSMAIQARPDKANAISGLLITGVFGGAVIPPLMGLATDTIGNQNGSLIVILGCICYLLYCSFGVKVIRTEN